MLSPYFLWLSQEVPVEEPNLSLTFQLYPVTDNVRSGFLIYYQFGKSTTEPASTVFVLFESEAAIYG